MEVLEDRQLLSASAHLDFGTPTSPVAPGYQQALPTAYSASSGFGWAYSLGLSAVDRGASVADPLSRDFLRAQQGHFLVDLANGTYNVTITLGDANAATSRIYIWAGEASVATNFSTNAGQFKQVSFQTTISTGHLSLFLVDLAGSGQSFALDALDVSSTGSGTAPAANAGPSQSGIEGSGLRFTGSASGGTAPLTYLWTFGDGTSASGTLTPTHTYADNGTYTVTLLVTDASGQTGSASTTATVSNVAPTGTLSNNGPVALASTAIVSFSNQSDPSSTDTTVGFKYSYDFNNDGIFEITDSSSSSATVPASFLTTGTHVVKGRIKDKDGGFTDYTTTITVSSSAPTATFSNGGAVNEASTGAVAFTNATGGSGGYTYSYDFDNNGTFEITDSTAATATVPASYLADGPGTRVVHGRIKDSSGAFNDYTTTITINNVAPTATFANSGTVNEGSVATVSFTNSADTSSVDAAAGFKYSYDFNNDGTFEITDSASASATVPASYLDDGPGTRVVHGRIKDKDGGFTDYTTTISINNVAPTASFSNSGPVTPGNTATVSFASQSDPSNTDAAAGFKYSYDFNNDGIFEITDSSSSSATVPASFLTTGTHVVKGRIKDKDGGFTDYTTTITVSSSAPTATFSNGGAVNEASTGAVAFTNATGGSGGYTYSYDFDNNGTFEITDSTAATATVPASYLADGPGTRVVHGRIKDSSGAFSDYTTTITINNVAPTATFANSGAVNEGSVATVSLTNSADTSSVDTAAGFKYSYDFNNDGTFEITDSASASATVPASYLDDGPGTRVVHGRIKDKDGGFTEYTTTISINNVAPTASSGGPYTGATGSAINFAASATDPSTADTTAGFTYGWTFGDGATGSGRTATHTYANPGTYNVVVMVTDKNGGTGSASTTATVTTSSGSGSYIITPYDKIPNFGAHPTVVSAQSGAWSNPSTWSTGVVPTTGDIVSIEPNTTVTYDAVSTAALNTVIIQNGGQLVFRTDISTTLTLVNFLVLQGGTLQIGTAATPVAANVLAQVVFADQPIDTTKDPSQYGNGLIALGKVTMAGAPKTETFINLATEPKAGDTTLSLSQAASGWRVGDKVYLPDTRQLAPNQRNTDPTHMYYVPEWETLTIGGISPDGKTLTLTAPLQFDHLGARDGDGVLTFLPDVADLTRNVVVHSQNMTGTRGYTYFTRQADVDIRYVTFGGLGRTTISPLDSTKYDASGNVTHVGGNQAGRNPVSFAHLIGPSTIPADGFQYTFVGNTVMCPLTPMPFRWGIDINDSFYGLIQDNVVNNWAGAGIMTETGDESYNVIDHNFVTRVTGTGKRADSGEVGSQGDGIWLAGPNHYVRNNVITDINSAGQSVPSYGITLFFIDNSIMHAAPLPAFQGADPSDPTQRITVDMRRQPLLQIANDEIYGAMEGGLEYWFVNASYTQSFGTASSVISGLKVWGFFDRGVFGYPAARLTFDGLTIRGDFNQLGNGTLGFVANDYYSDNVIVQNSDIQGMTWGVEPSTATAGGSSIVQNTYLRNSVDVFVRDLWTSGVSSVMLPRTVILRNDQFAAPVGRSLQAIQMWMPDLTLNLSGIATNIVQTNQVYVYDYNGVAGNNFQVYFQEQGPNVVVPVTAGLLTAAPVAGLTNQQLWAQFGMAIAGSVAPTSQTMNGILDGFVRPF